MSRELQIISWNVLDGINNPEVQSAIIDTDLDIGVFPESASEDESVLTETTRRFEAKGYQLYAEAYDDVDGRKDRHTLAVVFKPELVRNVRALRLVSRTALALELHDNSIFVGVHLDDRRELTRVVQTEALVTALDGQQSVLAGDFNAMHYEDSWAKRLRLAEPLARRMPARDPGEPMHKLQRIGSLAQRLTAMANGLTMDTLTTAHFTDADPLHTPTMAKGPLKVQLDHILYRGDIDVVTATQVENANGLSDHNRIRATLALS